MSKHKVRDTSKIVAGDGTRHFARAGVKLDDLTDATLSSASDKQILQYESATSQWKNVTPDFLNPINGYTKT